MTRRSLYLVPILAAAAVTGLASLLLLQIVWRPWSGANTSARTDLNLREIVPLDYTRTPVAWIGATPAAAPPAAAAGAPSPAPSPTAGRALYFAKGCAACHGADARGGAVGPPIAGTEIPAIFTQVRTPRESMPAFPASTIPDADLDQIAAYVKGLAPAGGADGRALYFDKGCAACHGPDARGSSVAPPVAGFAARTIVAQVHRPRARMPVFEKGALTRQELEQIATYLSRLPRVAPSAGGR